MAAAEYRVRCAGGSRPFSSLNYANVQTEWRTEQLSKGRINKLDKSTSVLADTAFASRSCNLLACNEPSSQRSALPSTVPLLVIFGLYSFPYANKAPLQVLAIIILLLALLTLSALCKLFHKRF